MINSAHAQSMRTPSPILRRYVTRRDTRKGALFMSAYMVVRECGGKRRDVMLKRRLRAFTFAR